MKHPTAKNSHLSKTRVHANKKKPATKYSATFFYSIFVLSNDETTSLDRRHKYTNELIKFGFRFDLCFREIFCHTIHTFYCLHIFD